MMESGLGEFTQPALFLLVENGVDSTPVQIPPVCSIGVEEAQRKPFLCASL
jgi:hypothetical protein